MSIKELGEEFYLMIITQQLVQKVNGLGSDKPLVLGIHKALPALLRKPTKNVVVLLVELNVIFVEVFEEVVCPEDFCDLHQLVRVTVSMEERLFSEDHGSEHGTQRPHVKRVVVFLKVNEQFWAFEIPGRHAHVVFGSRVIEFC